MSQPMYVKFEVPAELQEKALIRRHKNVQKYDRQLLP
ncbi:MAG: hypothetical protein AEth_02033 [Candidatus Argoarchaeum ethanivorans]|uniref:Uncharacterized protein n=1 Tax=Candidatus Argoarchaeum ethanivorans TaxID=2608793 RepID=A0A8B3RZJ6_9EURY|nr:MAG: hypothetical protein AEth_02033 [Candidatus Argoarchaeum ethanivorans]